MENIIKSYCDHLVAYSKAEDAENWVIISMETTLNYIRNKLKGKYPFVDEYSDYDYLYLASYCEENNLDFIKAATEVLDSEDHDVYGYINELNHQKYNAEILNILKPGMSVELNNGDRWDVIIDEKDVVWLKATDNVRLISLDSYKKDGKYEIRKYTTLDIVAIYPNTKRSPKQKPVWKREEKRFLLDDLKNGMYVVLRNGSWAVVCRNNGLFYFDVEGENIIKAEAWKYGDDMEYQGANANDIVEVWQYGECIWKEERSDVSK